MERAFKKVEMEANKVKAQSQYVFSCICSIPCVVKTRMNLELAMSVPLMYTQQMFGVENYILKNASTWSLLSS
jgi:hypothetical protein